MRIKKVIFDTDKFSKSFLRRKIKINRSSGLLVEV